MAPVTASTSLSGQGKGEMKTRRHLIISLIAAVFAGGCGDELTAPLPGTLRVSTTSIGEDLDLDGYSVLVDGDLQLPISNFGRVLIEEVTAGQRQVSLGGLSANCSVDGSSTQSVTVQSETVTDIAFTVRCDATGVEVTARSTGADYPLAGYPVTIGGQATTVPANGRMLLTRLAEGEHTVSLTPSENCSVSGNAVVSAKVSNRAISPIVFDLECKRSDKRIAFVSESFSRGVFPTVSVMAGDIGGTGFATIDPGHGPAWAPDGRLVYSNAGCDFYYYYPCSGGLVFRDATKLELMADVSGVGAEPSWSPDGKLIAFVPLVRGHANSRLSLLSMNDFTVRSLSIDEGNPGSPAWSPDGQHIVFRCALARTLCLVRKDGTGLIRLLPPSAPVGAPAWSPDGSRIAFDIQGVNGVKEIRIINPEGTPIASLTSGFDPAWSPDGSKLIFARVDGLYIMNADGSNVTQVTKGRHSAPAWRP